MSDTWRIVVVLLAAGFLVEAVVLVALMRQVGAVLLRVGPTRAVDVPGGPKVGTMVEVPGREPTGRPALVVFTSSACEYCKALVPRLRWMHETYGPGADHGHQLDLIAVGTDGSAELRAEHARELDGFARTDLITLMQDWDIPGTPFAVALDAEQRVKGAEVVNTPDELETLATIGLELQPVPAGASGDGEQTGLVITRADGETSDSREACA